MDFDNINEHAKKFRLSVERDAFMAGVRFGFQLASEEYLEQLSNVEKYRTKSIIIINNNESK